MATLQELLSQKAALDRQIDEAKRAQHDNALAKIHQLMADNGLTVADISTAAARPRRASKAMPSGSTRKKVEAKYRHPTTGESWSGRGLKPRWLSLIHI